MTNHPNRSRGPYTAEIGGDCGRRMRQFRTIRECRAWAEEYGTTADWCEIYSAAGQRVGQHNRDRNGDGLRWFRAAI